MIVQAVERRLGDAAGHRLTILANLHQRNIEQLVDDLPARLGLSRIALGPELGQVLRESRPGRRTEDAEHWLRHRCRDLRNQPALVTDIDLLFHPKLDPHGGFPLDPLRLFELASRDAPLRVVWPGRFDGTTLTYAVPEHSHYRRWTRPAAHVIDVDEVAAR